MRRDPWLFVVDLDNTLYDADSGVFQRMNTRITEYIRRTLSVGWKEAEKRRVAYWRRYGTTLRGLMLHHQVDPEDFLRDVHDVRVEELLGPDPALVKALECLPGRRVIHTNGTREHAERVLRALGASHCFHRIYDIRFHDYRPKPCLEGLRRLLAEEGIPAERSMVIDDMPDNLDVARHLGAATCLVRGMGNADGVGSWTYEVSGLSAFAQEAGFFACVSRNRRNHPPVVAGFSPLA